VRRHELDIASLIAGLVFVGISAAYLVGAFTDVHVSGAWILPLALIGLGAAGLAGTLRRGLRSDADAEIAEIAETPGHAGPAEDESARPE
jgi:hypothetical protein